MNLHLLEKPHNFSNISLSNPPELISSNSQDFPAFSLEFPEFYPGNGQKFTSNSSLESDTKEGKKRGLGSILEGFNDNLKNNKRDLEKLRQFPEEELNLRFARKKRQLPRKFEGILENIQKKLPTNEMKQFFDDILRQISKKFTEEELQQMNIIFQEKLPPMILTSQEDALKKELKLREELEQEKAKKDLLDREIIEQPLEGPPQEMISRLEARKTEVQRIYEQVFDDNLQQIMKKDDLKTKIHDNLLEIDRKHKEFKILEENNRIQGFLNKIYDFLQRRYGKIMDMIRKITWNIKEVSDTFIEAMARIRILKAEVKIKEEIVDSLELDLKNKEWLLYNEKVSLSQKKKELIDQKTELYSSKSQVFETKFKVKTLIKENLDLHEVLRSENKVPEEESLNLSMNFEFEEEKDYYSFEIKSLELEEAQLIDQKLMLHEKNRKNKENSLEFEKLVSLKNQYSNILKKSILIPPQSTKFFPYLICVYILLIYLIISRFLQ